MLADRPLTRTQLAERLASRWPGHDPAEGSRLLEFAAPAAAHDVRITTVS